MCRPSSSSLPLRSSRILSMVFVQVTLYMAPLHNVSLFLTTLFVQTFRALFYTRALIFLLHFRFYHLKQGGFLFCVDLSHREFYNYSSSLYAAKNFQLCSLLVFPQCRSPPRHRVGRSSTRDLCMAKGSDSLASRG